MVDKEVYKVKPVPQLALHAPTGEGEIVMVNSSAHLQQDCLQVATRVKVETRCMHAQCYVSRQLSIYIYLMVRRQYGWILHKCATIFL